MLNLNEFWPGGAISLVEHLFEEDRLHWSTLLIAEELTARRGLPAAVEAWARRELHHKLLKATAELWVALRESAEGSDEVGEELIFELLRWDDLLAQSLRKMESKDPDASRTKRAVVATLDSSTGGAQSECRTGRVGPEVQRLLGRWCPAGHDTAPRFLAPIAKVAWASEVQQACSHIEKRFAFPAALPLALLDAALPHIATMSLPGQRLFRMGLIEVTRRWAVHQADPLVSSFDGGLTGFAKSNNLSTKGLRRALNEGAKSSFRFKGAQIESFWCWENTRGSRHRGPGQLRWEWSSAFLPQRWKAKLTGPETYLVPIPHREPPLVGSRTEHAAQLALQLVVMRELRVNIEDYEHHRGVKFSAMEWKRLADQVGLGTRVEQVVEAWRCGSSGQPPFLDEAAADRVRLHPDFRVSERFMLDGLENTRNARRRGRLSARMKKLEG